MATKKRVEAVPTKKISVKGALSQIIGYGLFNCLDDKDNEQLVLSRHVRQCDIVIIFNYYGHLVDVRLDNCASDIDNHERNMLLTIGWQEARYIFEDIKSLR